MISFKIFCLIVSILMYVVMMSIMIIFERDKPKRIIIWSILFLFTQLIGFIAYIVHRKIYHDKCKSLVVKELEDNVYTGLSSAKMTNKSVKYDDDLLLHNELAFDAKVVKNTNFDILNSYDKFKTNLLKELKSSKKYILLELDKINPKYFEDIIEVLKERAESGVIVKLVHEKRIPRKIVKTLRMSKAKVYRFSKKNVCSGEYVNIRNIIVIDGRVAYLGSLNIDNKQLDPQVDVASAVLKIKGDLVQNINLALHQDIVFASGKYIEYDEDEEKISNDSISQYVSNKYESSIELLLIRAICKARKSIQMELTSFIPTESIMSLLHFAINSNIDVRLMVPLKTNIGSRFYASRAYAKELALLGANVYLYDGYIRFNAINVDDDYLLYGAFSMDRAKILTNLQNICVIKDNNIIHHFNKLFDEGINNSYRINNAKYMLLREKFFKNFV